MAGRDVYQYRPIVYICSHYSGNIQKNTERAIKYSRFAVDHGAIPVTSHLYLPLFMNEEIERELAMRMDLILLDRCEAIWVFGDEITDGMKAEIDRAKKRGISIRYVREEEADS